MRLHILSTSPCFVEFTHLCGGDFEVVVADDGKNVYSKLKGLLFPKSGSHRKPAVPGPCENLELFGEIMTSLPQLQDDPRDNDVNKLLLFFKKQLENFSTVTRKEFPFYVVVIGYFALRNTTADMEVLIKVLKTKFEDIEINEVISCAIDFLRRTTDVKFCIEVTPSEPTYCSTCMYHGCLRMIESGFDVYTNTLWICMAALANSKGAAAVVTRYDFEAIWKKYLTMRAKARGFTREDLNKVKKALKVLRPLKEKINHNFLSVLNDMYLECNYKSLKLADSFLHTLNKKEGLSFAAATSNQFRLYYAQRLTEPESLLNRAPKMFVSQELIKNGMSIIRELEKMIECRSQSEHSVDIKYTKNEIEEWVKLLIKLILLSTNTSFAEMMIKESTGSLQLSIKKQLVDQVSDKISGGLLSIRDFSPLLKTIWNQELVMKFIQHYQFAKFPCSVRDSNWIELFNRFSAKFDGKGFEKFVLIFLRGSFEQSDDYNELFMKLLKLVTKDYHFLINRTKPDDFKDFFDEVLEEIDVYSSKIDIEKILKYSLQSNNSFGETLLSMLEEKIILEFKKKHDEQMFEVLIKLSEKIANNSTGKHVSLCWNVVNSLFRSIPKYSPQFNLNQYISIIRSTGVIARSRFAEWFSINPAKFHLEKKTTTDSPYVVWVGDCFEEILSNLEMMEEERVDYGGIKTLHDNISTINKLLEMLMPKDLAQKLQIKDAKLKRVVEEFDNYRDTLYNLIIRRVGDSKTKLITQSLFSLLYDYGLKCPQHLLDHTNKCFSSSIERMSKTKAELRPSCELHILKSVKSSIEAFIEPIASTLKLFEFFALHKSVLFDAHVRNQLKGSEVTISRFGIALENTQRIMQSFVDGTITYSILALNGAVDLQNMDTEVEFEIFERALRLHILQSDGSSTHYKSWKYLLKLFQVANHIQTLEELFSRLHLQKIAEDPEFVECFNLSEKFRGDHCNLDIKLSDAKKSLDDILERLCLEKSSEIKVLEMLQYIRDSSELQRFIASKKFYGKDGLRSFYQQYELITAQLQHMEYDENVLNNLPAAVKLLSPFQTIIESGIEQPFKHFMLSLKSKSGQGIKELQIVNRNISLITQWFSQAHEKNVILQLEDILKSGLFCFINESKGHTFRLSFHNAGDTDFEVVWNSEEIHDFAMAVKFYEKGDSERNAEAFRYSIKVADQVLDVLQRAHDIGYLLETKPMPCGMSADEKTRMVQDISKEVDTFIKEVAQYQDEYPWLLLISMPKIVLLSNLLSQRQFWTLSVAYELNHIMESRNEFDHNVEVIQRAFDNQESLQCLESPVRVVGKFLNDTSKLYCKEIVWQRERISSMHHLKLCSIRANCLLETIYAVYKDEDNVRSHNFLVCGLDTSEIQIELLFKRAKKFINTYMVIGIDNLSFKLQEVFTKQLKNYHFHSTEQQSSSVIYLLETKPSFLRDFSWLFESINIETFDYSDAEVEEYYKRHLLECVGSVLLVHGNPGDGKTHFITKQRWTQGLKKLVVVTIDEAFSFLNAITLLREVYECELPEKTVGIFFNITMFELKSVSPLSEALRWFFFNLLVLGYVEDEKTGKSFAFTSDYKWNVFIEAPPMNLEHLFNAVPIFKCVCQQRSVTQHEFEIDSNAQLTCKYLDSFFKESLDPTMKRRNWFSPTKEAIVCRVSEGKDLGNSECHSLIKKCLENEDSTDSLYLTKYSLQLFVRYMYSRCKFLDDNLKTTFQANRQNLMKIMLSEVKAFVCGLHSDSWSSSIQHQFIFKSYEREKKLLLMCTSLDGIEASLRNSAKSCGIHIPDESKEIHDQIYLLTCISRAFDVDYEDCKNLIHDSQYILTPDYAMKMLNINECKQCNSPVIICGETGVGKTFLIEMVSKLWNLSANLKTKQLLLVENLYHASGVFKDEMKTIAKNFKDKSTIDESKLTSVLEKCESKNLAKVILTELRKNSIWLMLNTDMNKCVEKLKSSKILIKDVADVIITLLTSELRHTFFKLGVHSALTSDDIDCFFKDLIELCNFFRTLSLSLKLNQSQQRYVLPTVVAFLDEINTSSCGGCLKEIIADKTFHGVKLPSNLFVIGACNPHRGNSLLIESSSKELAWVSKTYYVQDLHPTLKLLMWNFGALTETEERHYVKLKLDMVIPTGEIAETKLQFTDLVVKSQVLMRSFAAEYIKKNLPHASLKEKEEEKNWAKSCVSQRDIQRVFTFFMWLKKVYLKHRPDLDKLTEHAFITSLGLVYYLRLNYSYREKYEKFISYITQLSGIHFLKTFDEDVNWLINKLLIPIGIAKTTVLKHNLFAITVCLCTKVPLILVGKPGTSKTLSVHIAMDNLKGIESHTSLLQDIELFPAIDHLSLQCSKQTTSIEIEALFKKVIKRDQTYTAGINCAMFMDEAGLPEERHESLKVLHHYLDKNEVAFVAISNHILDAAKTNRAITVLIPKTTEEDLCVLVRGCCTNNEAIVSQVIQYCPAYDMIIQDKDWCDFFGMRDFIHFLHYIQSKGRLPSRERIWQAFERNFNGTEDFHAISKIFFQDSLENFNLEGTRDILKILKESINDKCDLSKGYIRYKLIIDPSEDDSMISFLFKFDILNRLKSKRFIISNLFRDHDTQKVNIITSVCHAVTKGCTVIMNQTHEIHECFYDLFNLRFRVIEDSSGCRYYANVSIGRQTKPILVHPDFQCIVVLKQSKLKDTPTPFLNRFEKYLLSHKILFDSIIQRFPEGIQQIVSQAQEKVESFIEMVQGPATLYGYRKQSLFSLLLLMMSLKSADELQIRANDDLFRDDERLYFHVEILKALKACGINIIQFSTGLEDMKNDVVWLFELESRNKGFSVLFNEPTAKNLRSYINKAIGCLNGIDCPVDSLSGVSFVVSYIVQLLIRSLCKTLMQIMTPEGIISFWKSIPCSYLDTYLNHQNHFGLKDIIESEELASKTSSFDKLGLSNDTYVQKFIIYCRTSSLVTNDLPKRYPLPEYENLQFLQTNISSNLSGLKILKLNFFHSHQSFADEISDFFKDPFMRKFVLVIDMQESSPDGINHVRMIIEEFESCVEVCKDIFLLLHFPAPMFSNGIYPSLFLHGWHYRYIDSLALHAESGQVNIKSWMMQCVNINLPNPSSQPQEDTSNIKRSLHKSISSEITPLVTEFSSCKCISQDGIKKLLTNTEITSLLCERFVDYFDVQLFTQYLHDAARITQERESMLNMKVQIEERIKENFFSYLKYVISLFHSHGIINTVMSIHFETLFKYICDLIPYIPVPESIMKLVKGTSFFKQSIMDSECPYLCPFSSAVYDEVESILEQSLNVQETMLEQRLTQSETRRRAVVVITEKIQQSIQDPATFGARVLAGLDGELLWHNYLHDFVFNKLNIRINRPSFIHDLILAMKEEGDRKYRSSRETGVPHAIAMLHFQFHVRQRVIRKHSSKLKLLNEIEKYSEYDHNTWIELNELDIKSPIDMINKSDSTTLCQYVLSAVYELFIKSPYTQWNEIYIKMISDDSHISTLHNLDGNGSSIQAKWNRMHTMHCVLCSVEKGNGKNEEFVALIYSSLLKLTDDDVGLNSVHEMICSVEMKTMCTYESTVLYDKLFAHFFSNDCPAFNIKDVRSFMSIVAAGSSHLKKSIIAYYMKRILKKSVSEGGGQGIKNIFNHEARSEVGEIIIKGTRVGDEVNTSSSVRSIYCLLLKDEILMRDFPANDLILQCLTYHQKIEKKDRAKLEAVLVTIEYEALIQAALKTLAINLKCADSKVIEDFLGYQLKNYTDYLRSLLQKQEHTDILIMHMLEQTRCLHLFNKNFSSLCSTLKFADSDSKGIKKVDHIFGLFKSLLSGSTKDAKNYFSAFSDAMNRSSKADPTFESLIRLHSKRMKLKCGIGEQSLFDMTVWLHLFQEHYEKSSSKVMQMQNSILKSLVSNDISLLLNRVTSCQSGIFHSVSYQAGEGAALRSIAVVIATIIGMGPSSGYLWTHLFHPMKLKDTFIPGFLNEECLSNTSTYFAGTELSDEGLYKNYSQFIEAKKRKLFPQYLYVLLWINFASLSVSSLGAENTDFQQLVSDKVSLEKVCEMQLLLLWKSMQQRFNILHEELEYLIVEIMDRFVQIFSTGKNVPESFTTKQDRDKFEDVFIERLLRPIFDAFGNATPCKEVLLLNKARSTEEKQICVLKCTDVQYVVTSLGENFVSEYFFALNALEIVIQNLPILVELYDFIHRELSHHLSRANAEGLSIREIQRQLGHLLSPEDAKLFKIMFSKFISCSKQFVEATGKTECEEWLVDQDSKVISVLTFEDGSGDCLFKIISSMVDYHNQVITNLCNASGEEVGKKVTPFEIQRKASLRITEDFVARCSLTTSKGKRTTLFAIQRYENALNLEQIRCDVLENFRTMNCIISLQNCHVLFKFYSSTLVPLDGISSELDAAKSHLPKSLQIDLSEDLCKRLKSNFSSSNHSKLMNVVSGLTRIAGSLLKYHEQHRRFDPNVKLKFYIQSTLQTSAGIKEYARSDLSGEQLRCLEEIKIGMLISAAKFLCIWISDGYTEYCQLDYIFKCELSTQSKDKLIKNLLSSSASSVELLSQLQNALTRLQPHLAQKQDKYKESLKTCLESQGEKLQILQLLPESLLLENYVYLCIETEKLLSSAKKEVSSHNNGSDQVKDRLWIEWVNDPLPVLCISQNDEDNASHVLGRYMSEDQVLASMKQFEMKESDEFSACTESVAWEHEHQSEFESGDESALEPSQIFVEISDDDDDSETREDAAKILKDYTTEDLLELLEDIGMEQYKPIFEEGEIDGDTVNEWKISHLEKEAEIANSLDQLKIYLAFCQRKPETRKRSDTFTMNCEIVLQFLQSKPDFQQYVDDFRAKNITGEILLNATPLVLQDIGVKSILEASKIIVFFEHYVGHSEYNHEHSVADLISKLGVLGKDDYVATAEENGLSLRILEVGKSPVLTELFRISKIKAKTLLKKLGVLEE